MGLNESGQLGHSANLQFVPVSVGIFHPSDHGPCISLSRPWCFSASEAVQRTDQTPYQLCKGRKQATQLWTYHCCVVMQVPQEVQMSDDVEQVAAGHHHTLLLTRSGDVWACGRNSRGQLGLGGKSSSFAATPQRVQALVGKSLSADTST